MKKITRKDLIKFLESKGISVLESGTKRVKRSAEPEMPTYEITLETKDCTYEFDYFYDTVRYGVGFLNFNPEMEKLIKKYLDENKIEYWEM